MLQQKKGDVCYDISFCFLFIEHIDCNSKYISDFQNISAQLQIYQRFLKYIDLPAKIDNNRTLYKAQH
ncbi:hypothetical protein CN286_29220 [Bacillus anthracis]|nr:hypothetical protein CN286_29220 [Bacillus anthracis]PFM44945.1 hypothetical protein COJ45_22580 [Bacillus cereus]PGS23719.1 hypothetical protein COC59_17080 [Bacillus cereus]